MVKLELTMFRTVAHFSYYPFSFHCMPILRSKCPPSPFHLYPLSLLFRQYNSAIVASLVLQNAIGNGYHPPLGESSACLTYASKKK